MSAQTHGSTIEREQIATTDEPGKAAHIVYVPPDADTTAHALVLEARVFGLEVTALCGFRWVPQQNPAQLPVCGKCLEIYQESVEPDDREELPDA